MKTKSDPIQILSLGGGVQSSTLALMAAAGEVEPMPVAAVFADTGDEPEGVYTWLNWLTPKLPFPVVVGRKEQALFEHIREAIEKRERVSKPPLFTKAEEVGGDEGILTRDCTRDFKVSVIQREVRQIMAHHGAKKVVQWIGISLDEIVRMKPARVKYSEHRWPLIEKRMSRHDCLNWMESRGYPKPPRSACVYCPHHSNAEWRRIRDEEPDSWQKAIEFDQTIRNGVHKVRQECFVHRDCVPLQEVDLSTDTDRGQGLLWGNECEGMCGV